MDSLDNDNLNNDSNPKVSLEHIQSLIENYRSNQLTHINQQLEIEDAHSIWFSLGTLKSFIARIEEETQKIDSSTLENDLGIRFYYAAYPEVPEAPIPENFSKKHTLVMVPTKRINGLNHDFNPFDEENVLAVTGKMALAQNHGDLVPPGASTNIESY